MRPKTLLFGACLLLAFGGAVWAAEDANSAAPLPVLAEDSAPVQAPVAVADADGTVALDEALEGSGMAPAPSEGEGVAEAPPAALATQSTHTRARGHHIALGPVGVDSAGRVGRIHTVTRGDTLWDISEAYLGTPWVWPSVWRDNRDISNPHLIVPGDRIWITSTEMRRVSDAEVAELVAEAAVVLPEESSPPAELEQEPADMGEEELDQEVAIEEGEPDSMSSLPVAVPGGAGEGGAGRIIRVPMRPDMSFVSEAQIKAATSVLESPVERMALALADPIYIGLGEGEVEVGERFTIFRDFSKVYDPVTRDPIGYHVDVRGSAEVIEVQAESSIAVIRESLGAIVRGDMVIAKEYVAEDVTVKAAPAGLDGRIAFLPHGRTLVGTTDYVYVNMGTNDGVEVGTDLEVYESGGAARDKAKKGRVMVRTPDSIMADLVVVIARENTAVAYVVHTRRELGIGDHVRGATRDYVGTYY